MSAINGRKWRWPAVGAVGVAVGASAVPALAEPLKEPLLPANLSQPQEPPAPVTPAGIVLPTLPSPAVPSVPKAPALEAPKLPEPPAPIPLPAPPVESKALPIPAPEPLPIPTPEPLVAPKAVEVPVAPPVVPSLPVEPTPVKPVFVPASPAGLPAPVEAAPIPRSVAIPDIAPPALPAKSDISTPPPLPSPADFNLRPEESRNTFNPEAPAAELPRTPGEPPMPLPTRQMALSAAIGLALASTPPSSIAADPVDAPAKTEVESLRKDIADLKAEIGKLKTFKLDLEDAVFGKKVGDQGVDGLYSRMSKLDNDMKSVNETLKRIESRLGETPKTTVGSSPLTNPMPSNATKSTVRIVNDYPVDVSIVLNGKSHRLTQGEVKLLEVPAGNYTYELLTAGASPVSSSIKDGETITLRIR